MTFSLSNNQQPIPLFSSIQHHTRPALAHIQIHQTTHCVFFLAKKKWISSNVQRSHFPSFSSPRENNVSDPTAHTRLCFLHAKIPSNRANPGTLSRRELEFRIQIHPLHLISPQKRFSFPL